MQLSNEDNLRLNVLMSQDLKAVRIDESKLVVHALTGKGEVRVQLNPTCRDEKYVRLVKELLSNKIMGSPGGYPVYIKRWTRMGQERREESLAQLLLLGEPEAVVAVVHAPVLSAELARYAWWSLPSTQNARKLLEKPQVVESDLARELVEFLLEFLPFEEDHRDMIESARLCLQPGLLSDDEVEDLWARSKRKQSIYVGFLHSRADDLPETSVASPALEQNRPNLEPLVAAGNPYAVQLQRYLSSTGQAFLKTVLRVIDKAATQETMVALFQALARYHEQLPLAQCKRRTFEEAEMVADAWLDAPNDAQLAQCIDALPGLEEKIRALLILGQMGEITLFPIFGVTDGMGSVMRKKLRPLTDPLQQQINQLLS
jgi:hypothetical protein